MKFDYRKEPAEMVRVKGIECEFYDVRIDRETVPEGKYIYEVRHTDEDWGEPCQIEAEILVNFFGTLVCDRALPLVDGSLDLEDDGDFEFNYL